MSYSNYTQYLGAAKCCNIKTGSQGSVGPRGPQGHIGPVGYTGSGSTGSTGAQGAQGSTGPQGITGERGADGAIGGEGGLPFYLNYNQPNPNYASYNYLSTQADGSGNTQPYNLTSGVTVYDYFLTELSTFIPYGTTIQSGLFNLYIYAYSADISNNISYSLYVVDTSDLSFPTTDPSLFSPSGSYVITPIISNSQQHEVTSSSSSPPPTVIPSIGNPFTIVNASYQILLVLN